MLNPIWDEPEAKELEARVNHYLRKHRAQDMMAVQAKGPVKRVRRYQQGPRRQRHGRILSPRKTGGTPVASDQEDSETLILDLSAEGSESESSQSEQLALFGWPQPSHKRRLPHVKREIRLESAPTTQSSPIAAKHVIMKNRKTPPLAPGPFSPSPTSTTPTRPIQPNNNFDGIPSPFSPYDSPSINGRYNSSQQQQGAPPTRPPPPMPPLFASPAPRISPSKQQPFAVPSLPSSSSSQSPSGVAPVRLDLTDIDDPPLLNPPPPLEASAPAEKVAGLPPSSAYAPHRPSFPRTHISLKYPFCYILHSSPLTSSPYYHVSPSLFLTGYILEPSNDNHLVPLRDSDSVVQLPPDRIMQVSVMPLFSDITYRYLPYDV